MKKPCVINYAAGRWYPAGQRRLSLSLKETGWGGDLRLFTSAEELGCPSHSEAPYAFKPAAFNWAIAEGCDVILWLDAAAWANRSIQPLMDRIERDGHVLFGDPDPWNSAQWTNDRCLHNMGVSRDEAQNMRCIMATCMGFDARHPRSVEFLRRWTDYSLDGSSFVGGWENKGGSESADPRCRGHRHDQAVAGILADQMGMEKIEGKPLYFQHYHGSSNGGMFKYGQRNDMSQVFPGVCVLTQGM